MVKKWYVQYELKLQFVFQTLREEETKKSGVSEFDGQRDIELERVERSVEGGPTWGSSLDTLVGIYLILLLDLMLSLLQIEISAGSFFFFFFGNKVPVVSSYHVGA